MRCCCCRSAVFSQINWVLAEAQLSAGSTYLESKNALVRIPVAGKVCAYALDPHEVWKGYNTSKNYAAFVTKTLVNKDGDIQRRIMAMFSN
uniref:Helix-turn-helix domain-containing protein n=1 Tax=Escherichia coli TaxID=562 RepID=A0A3G4RXH4_ECOLX|nr:helix-turn-helix domain-containing protein [Escherichia coli]